MKRKAFQSLNFFQSAGSPLPRGPLHLKDFPGFSARDLRALELYYASRLARHHSPEQKVGWNTAESQRLRFEALTSVGPLQGAKILDVGCGLGALWGYLKSQKIETDYTGVDLFPNVIREAKQLYPEARFETRLLTARPFPVRAFDYSFLSGVFNMKVQDNWGYLKAILTTVLKQTKKAVAFNVLNTEAGLMESNRFTVTSGELVAFGRRLGVSRAHLMDHYHPFDLTLFLYK